MPRVLTAGDEIEVAIDYSARPRRGLYFVGPDDGYPNKPVQAWTQGEDEDSRYWFPCYDYPNNRATSEVVATVPENFTAVSNGALLETTSNRTAKIRTFHWRHDVPHSTYLITLAAGEFTMIEERAGDTPVTYYCAPGREDDARRAFGNTPRMIQFFERKIEGVRVGVEVLAFLQQSARHCMRAHVFNIDRAAVDCGCYNRVAHRPAVATLVASKAAARRADCEQDQNGEKGGALRRGHACLASLSSRQRARCAPWRPH
jgi:hypothetical protein